MVSIPAFLTCWSTTEKSLGMWLSKVQKSFTSTFQFHPEELSRLSAEHETRIGNKPY